MLQRTSRCANVVMPKGKTDLMPEFLMPVVRAVMRIQAKVLAAMEALLRDLLCYDAIVKPMAKCIVTMELAYLDLKAVMGRQGISKLGLDKSKSGAKAAPFTASGAKLTRDPGIRARIRGRGVDRGDPALVCRLSPMPFLMIGYTMNGCQKRNPRRASRGDYEKVVNQYPPFCASSSVNLGGLCVCGS